MPLVIDRLPDRNEVRYFQSGWRNPLGAMRATCLEHYGFVFRFSFFVFLFCSFRFADELPFAGGVLATLRRGPTDTHNDIQYILFFAFLFYL